MKRAILCLILASASGVAAAQSSFQHDYKSFFGKEDRIGLYSDAASSRFSEAVLQTIRSNTILMDCGSSGKPSTAFIAKTQNGPHIFSAAHNLTMAENSGADCTSGNAILPKGMASPAFEDSGTLEDAAHDIAHWPNITANEGFKICKALELTSKFVLVQSMDGNGQLGISPVCKVKSVKGKLITTTCRGHYKASGAPLLSIAKDNVCVAGVFNAHSGRQFEYESYAASLRP